MNQAVESCEFTGMSIMIIQYSANQVLSQSLPVPFFGGSACPCPCQHREGNILYAPCANCLVWVHAKGRSAGDQQYLVVFEPWGGNVLHPLSFAASYTLYLLPRFIYPVCLKNISEQGRHLRLIAYTGAYLIESFLRTHCLPSAIPIYLQISA